MKRIVFVFLVGITLSACAVTKDRDSLIGQFKGQVPHRVSKSFPSLPRGEMMLSINQDGTFDLSWLKVDYTGTWGIIDEEHILLKFDEITDLFIQLRPGVILDRELTVKILGKSRILISPYKKDIMKRQKE